MDNTSQSAQNLSPLKQAYLAIARMEAKLKAMEQAQREPIAVIGMACRFPGGANHPDAYWRLLLDGVDAISEVPPSRWDIDRYYAPDPNASGKMSTRYGGFVEDIDHFDPQFFGISPREAATMDPQQRLLLEVSWEAIESAGIAPDQLAGSPTGVFVGIVNNDYQQLQLANGGIRYIDTYYGSGTGHSIASGRVSYVLGLRGPSVSVDTACSSSLVAVHLAVLSLRSGDCRMALAAGTNAMLAPEGTIALSKFHFMAPDGRCKAFDARADGFVRGEGCGVVVLKRLSDALADGDPIQAVILGSAANQDGASSGLTAPNGPSQEAVFRDALANAGVSPAEVGFVETHGTGTTLGDPIELQALGSVFKDGHSPDKPLYLGAVKTNIGHLESAAGIAGLIKLVLTIKHRTIPPNLHFTRPNPHVDWEALPLQVPIRPIPWQAEGRLVGGVSSFGFSGTNVHVVVAEAPDGTPEQPEAEQADSRPPVERPAHLLTLSAQTEKALKDLAGRFQEHLAQNSGASLADIAYTLNTGRAQFPHRLAVIASEPEAARRKLEAFLDGGSQEGLVSGRTQTVDNPRIAFLFTGQGSQYIGMGRRLYETQPAFRQAMDRCAEVLQPYLPEPLLEVIFSRPDLLDNTAYTQPALFALEYALAQLWGSWGVKPAAVIGHSAGEYVAACIAGIFSLEDGLKLIAHRARLMGSLPAGGKMAAVFAATSVVEEALGPYADRVSIAAVNGPANTVVSGSGDDVQALLERLARDGIKSRPLVVSHAFHSPLMDPILDEFARVAAEVTYHAPHTLFISNLTGEARMGAGAVDAEYWVRHVRQPVLFASGMDALQAAGCQAFLEIGPAPTLVAMGQRCLPEAGGLWLPSLRKDQDDWQVLLSSLAKLYCYGAQIDWAGFDRDYQAQGLRRRLPLPTYPFQRKRYWLPPRPSTPDSYPGQESAQPGRPLLGRRIRSALKDRQYEAWLSAGSFAFLADHSVSGRLILPTTAYIELALEAAEGLLGPDPAAIEDLLIHSPMVFEGEAGRVVQTVLSPDGSFQVYSQDQGGESEDWSLHLTGRIVSPKEQAPQAFSPEAVQAQCAEEIDPGAHYERLAGRGIDLGPSLRPLAAIHRRDSEALGRIRPGEDHEAEQALFRLHPALLDACLQVVEEALPRDGAAEEAYLPIAVDAFHFYRSPQGELWSRVTVRPAASPRPETITADIAVQDASDQVVALIEGLRLKRAAPMRDEAGLPAMAGSLYKVDWVPAPKAVSQNAEVAVEAVAERASARFPALSREYDLEAHHRLVAQLDQAVPGLVLDALRELGWSPTPGERFAAEALREQLGILPAYRRLLDRLLDILAEEGVLRRLEAGWEVIALPGPGQAPEALPALREQFPDAPAPLAITERCAGELAQALAGKADPLQLLFPGGSLELAQRLYEETGEARTYNHMVRESVQALLSARPGPLRVLEIGAGTGGTTSFVLPALPPETTRYTFTDIAPAFVAKARARFAGFPFVDFKALDLEKDPLAQGFEPGGYDLILAANVIHATQDLRQSLGHIRELLAPGGLLLMLEVTAPERWIDITFGLTDGWWRFTDEGVRPGYPLLSRGEWLDLLAGCGFEAAQALPEETELSKEAILLARKPFAGQEPQGWLVFGDASGVGQELAAGLRARGHRCTVVLPGDRTEAQDGGLWRLDPSRPEGFKRLLETAGQAFDGVVHLWSLDLPARPEGLDELENGQALGAGSLLHLVQALGGGTSTPALWIVTRGAQPAGRGVSGPAQASAWGLGKVIQLEHPEYRPRMVDLDPAEQAESGAKRLLDEILAPDGEEQVAYRDSQRFAARLVAEELKATQAEASAPAVCLEVGDSGVLDDLAIVQADRHKPGPGEVEIRVLASGLNFRDVLNALAMRTDPEPLGSECAGRIAALGPGVTGFSVGDPVVAVVNGAFASYVIAEAALVAPLPAGFDFAQAAAVPMAVMTAAYALEKTAGIQAGDRVLIHAAAGGVGQAAVQIALRRGAEVFATAGSPAKRQFLKDQGVQHVFDSRSLDFAAQVLDLTGGEGVDIILNSLAGEFIPQSVAVLANDGCFLEIGKRGIWTQEQFAGVKPNATYAVIDLALVRVRQPEAFRSLFAEVIQGAAAGVYPPLPLHTFPLEEISEAFRFMSQAKHIGKIVVTQSDERRSAAELPAGGASNRPPRFAPDPGATYLITGGLGGLGLLIARRWVQQGARHLVLVGRSAPSEEALAALREMEGAGAQVRAVQADVSCYQDLADLFAMIRESMPPLRGILHSAGVLADAALLRQDWERFARVMAPKVQGAWALHELSLDLDLDFFVLFSSTAALLGSPGQGNHAAANTFMDALAHYRRARGLPALSINWGVWSEVGAAAERNVDERAELKGLGVISPQAGLEILEHLLAQEMAQVAVLPVDWAQFLPLYRPGGAAPRWLSALSVPAPARAPAKPAAPRPAGPQSFRERLAAAPANRQYDLLLSFVNEQAVRVLGLEAGETLDQQRPLNEVGLDSLMAVELRNLLSSGLNLERNLPASLVFDYPTVEAIAGYLAKQLGAANGEGAPKPAGKPAPETPEDLLAALEDLPSDEVERLFSDRLKRG